MARVNVIQKLYVNDRPVETALPFRTKNRACIYLTKMKSELVSQGFLLNVNRKDPFDFYAYMEANGKIIKDTGYEIRPVD